MPRKKLTFDGRTFFVETAPPIDGFRIDASDCGLTRDELLAKRTREWLDKDFPSMIKLFPEVKDLTRQLNRFYDLCAGRDLWLIDAIYRDGKVDITFVPLSKFYFIKLPHKVHSKIIVLLSDLAADYFPSLRDLIGYRLDHSTLSEIKSRIKTHEHLILLNGGCSLLKELKFRLGLSAVREIFG